MGFEVSLWRAIAAFRVASLCYAAVLIGQNFRHYAHPVGGWAVFAIMAAWTAVAGLGYARLDSPRRPRSVAAPPARGLGALLRRCLPSARARSFLAPRAPRSRGRRAPLLGADLAVATACLLATGWVESPQRLHEGVPTLPVTWVGGPVLAWAVSGGRRGGAVAAFVVGAADVVVRGGFAHRPAQATLHGAVLLVIAGVVVGYVVRLAKDAEETLARAVELEARTRERERLARRIHDSVLQVLAFIQRRGTELGGEAAELGRLAGEQETALRAVVGVNAQPVLASNGEIDLRDALRGYASTTVTVSTPATPVRLRTHLAKEVAGAVHAALDNVRRHCGEGARAWVLVEDDGDAVTVSVRDDGPGLADGRLEEAARQGRLGVAQSIHGRIRDLGGSMSIVSVPGEGTEIELRVPRP